MGFSRQEHWSGLPFLSPEDLPTPGTEPTSLMSLALAGGFFTSSDTWDALREEAGALFFPVTKHSFNKQMNELNSNKYDMSLIVYRYLFFISPIVFSGDSEYFFLFSYICLLFLRTQECLYLIIKEM